MKKLFMFVAILVSMFVVFGPAFAENKPAPAATLTVSLDGLDPDLRAKLIEATKVAKEEAPKAKEIVAESVEKAKELASESDVLVKYMRDFALGLKEVCKELAISANEFIRTPVGFITMVVILTKYDVINAGGILNFFKELVLFLPLAIVGWYVMYRFVRRLWFGVYEKVPTNEPKKYEIKFVDAKWKNMTDDEQWFSVIVLIIAAILCFILTLVAIV